MPDYWKEHFVGKIVNGNPRYEIASGTSLKVVSQRLASKMSPHTIAFVKYTKMICGQVADVRYGCIKKFTTMSADYPWSWNFELFPLKEGESSNE